MNKSILKSLMMALLMALSASCQQLPEDDGAVPESKEESLVVKVRSVEGEEVPYPLYLYAFTKEGELASSQTIADSEDKMAMELEQGEYQIVALSGDTRDYQWPNKPTLEDVIVWTSSDGANTPLMVGREFVKVSHTQEAQTEITLSYMVASLGVKLKDVPKNVTDVQVTLLPLHSSLSFTGNYGGDSQSVKVGCTLSSDGIWRSEKVYIFPGNGKETYFSISFKTEEGDEVTYGYTYEGKPEVNHHFNVTGSYKGAVIVGGSFDVQDWEGSIDVEFDFGASVESEDEEADNPDEDEEEQGADLTNVPEVGSIWNGCIVADWGEADETGVEVLLLSLDEWDATVSEVEDITEGYSVNGISGWRLPNYEEAKVLRARFSGNALIELNELIKDYDPDLYGLSDGKDERYLCDKGGVIYSFKFAMNSNITEAKSRVYYLRLVKSYRISLD